MRRSPLEPALVLALAFQLGCGTLFSGMRQTVKVTTEPAGARVALYRLNGEPLPIERHPGDRELTTPRPVNGTPYLSIASSPGQCPEYKITKVDMTLGAMAESLLLAIPFIQVIGFSALMVDNATGGCCKIEPVVAVLDEDDSCR